MHILATFATLARQTQREVGPVVYHFCARDGNLVIFGQFSTILKFGHFWSILVNFGHVNFGQISTHKKVHTDTRRKVF